MDNGHSRGVKKANVLLGDQPGTGTALDEWRVALATRQLPLLDLGRWRKGGREGAGSECRRKDGVPPSCLRRREEEIVEKGSSRAGILSAQHLIMTQPA